jgi:hypothetical protein
MAEETVQTIEDAALVITQRMLRRLPASLWDQSLGTPQAQLYGSIALELARWLDAWALVRRCTLLQQADGIDLDVLLRDYGLMRFNRRPDAFARQIARQILWTPKGTLYSVQEVATLLTDAPQLCGRSGRLQPHWWVAMNQAVTMPRTYWQLGNALGEVWYLSFADNDICLSQYPPPGANSTPWPEGYTPVPGGGPPYYAGGREDVITLFWLQVPDETGVLWYLTLGTDGSCAVSLDLPITGPGTHTPVQLLDGHGEVWGLQVDRATRSLLMEPLSTPPTTPSYWRLRDPNGLDWIMAVNRGALITQRAPAPLGWIDMTPGGAPLDWVSFPLL